MNKLEIQTHNHRLSGHDSWLDWAAKCNFDDAFIHNVCSAAHCKKMDDPRRDRYDTSDNLLRELQMTLTGINFQTQAAYRLAEKNGIENVYDMQNVHGDFILIPLLVIKAQLLMAIKELRRSEISLIINNPTGE